MMKPPLSLFLKVSMDLGVLHPLSFWARSILYAPLLDNFDDILASTLLERVDV